MSTQSNIKGQTPEERELLRRESISKTLKKFYGSGEGRQKKSDALNKRWAKPEEHTKQSKRTKASWDNNSDFRKAVSDGHARHWTPAARRQNGEAVKRYLATPEGAAEFALRLKQIHLNPESNRRRSESMKRYNSSEEGRQTRSRSSKLGWEIHPGRKERMAERKRAEWAQIREALAGKNKRPKKRGGSVPGKLLSGSAMKIDAIARYQLQGKSNNWIEEHWKEVTGTHASLATAESFRKRHKALIAQRRVELSQTVGR